MNTELDKLAQIKADFTKFDKTYREAKGYGECCDKPCPAEIEDVMYQLISNVYRYIDSVQSNFYRWQDDFMSNHTILPKLTPSQLEKLLKAAGASDDFQVEKRYVFASKNRQGNVEFEVDLGKN